MKAIKKDKQELKITRQELKGIKKNK